MYYLDIFHLVIFGGEFSQHIVLAWLKSKTSFNTPTGKIVNLLNVFLVLTKYKHLKYIVIIQIEWMVHFTFPSFSVICNQNLYKLIIRRSWLPGNGVLYRSLVSSRCLLSWRTAAEWRNRRASLSVVKIRRFKPPQRWIYINVEGWGVISEINRGD